MKRIVYTLEIKEDQHGKNYLTIQRGKLGETYPVDSDVIPKVTDFITKNLKTQLEVWGIRMEKIRGKHT